MLMLVDILTFSAPLFLTEGNIQNVIARGREKGEIERLEREGESEGELDQQLAGTHWLIGLEQDEMR